MDGGEMEATLGDVLAFLDAFDADDEQQEHQEAHEEHSQPMCNSNGVSEAYRRRLETKYTTNLLRKKRREAKDLREQAAMLEARLKQLQQVTRSSCSGSRECKEMMAWAGLEEKAASELASRRRAERENSTLRARLKRQKKLREEIGRLIDKYRRFEGPIDDGRSLLGAEKIWAAAGVPASVSALTTLIPATNCVPRITVAKALEQLINQVDRVFASSFLRPQSSWLETNEAGFTREVSSSTTSNCSVVAAAEVLWRTPKQLSVCSPLLSNLVCISDDSYSLERSLLTIPCRQWDSTVKEGHTTVDVVLHIEHYSRRVYDQATGRTVLVTLALIHLPSENGGEVLLREYFWKCTIPVATHGNAGSITQTSYRIEPGNSKNNELSPAQQNVMSALALLTRRNHAAFQEWLLESST